MDIKSKSILKQIGQRIGCQCKLCGIIILFLFFIAQGISDTEGEEKS